MSAQDGYLPLLISVVLSLLLILFLEYLRGGALEIIVDEEILLERAASAAWQQNDTGFADPERAEAVRNAMRHAWHGYERYAWGADELRPESKQGKFGVLGGMGGFNGLGASVIDAMSTLHIMGLHEEFERAHAWVAENMTFDVTHQQSISFFETTIRVLGGLMAAHDLSGSHLFLEKAEDLGQRLLPVFSGTATGILTNNAKLPWTETSQGNDAVPLAECGSNLIEFGTLASRTQNESYRRAAENGMRFLHAKYQAEVRPVKLILCSVAALPPPSVVGMI